MYPLPGYSEVIASLKQLQLYLFYEAGIVVLGQSWLTETVNGKVASL